MSVGLEEQIGLRLDTEKLPVEIMIVDHVEKPSENYAVSVPSLSFIFRRQPSGNGESDPISR